MPANPAPRPCRSRLHSGRVRSEALRRPQQRRSRPDADASRHSTSSRSKAERRPKRLHPSVKRLTRRPGCCLPPGFSTEAPTESLAVSGNMANIDRGHDRRPLRGDRARRVRSRHRRIRARASAAAADQAVLGALVDRAGEATADVVKADAVDPAARVAVADREVGVSSGSPDAVLGRMPTTSRRTTTTAAPHSTARRTSFAPTMRPTRVRITGRHLRHHRRRPGARSPASTTARGARTLPRPITAIAATSSSISTGPFPPRRCEAGTSRQSRRRSSIP